jgi:UDP-GlcNAc:undecaprenyl-phosphate GlcNAc-1-phosphate transferase
MIAGLFAGIAAILIAAMLTPIVRRFAVAVGAVDVPGGRRIHVTATPRLGGVAIVVAYLTAVLATLSAWAVQNHADGWKPLGAFLGAGILIALAGALDDIRALGAKKKLFVQCVAASIAWAGGVRIVSTLAVPGFGHVEIGTPLSYVATLVWIVAFINAINLIDGLDGLAGGVAFFAAVTNLVVAVVTGNWLAAILNAALGGAVLGFLFYNFNPATIFMGDTGSMFLGYALGAAALMSGGQKESTVVSLLVPVIALGVPFTDTLLATVRRVLAKRSIFAADREHLHHRLLDLGLTHRRVVLILYACSLLLCVAALAAALGRSWQVGAAITGAVLTLVGVTRFAGYFEVMLLRRQQRSAALAASADALRRSLPSMVLKTETASSAAMVWAALERLLASGHFAYAEYCPVGEGPVWKWEQSRQRERREGKLVESSFPIRVYPGANEGALRFGCLSEEADLPPQTEVLLQVVADVVEAALVRVHVDSPKVMVRAVASPQET